MKHTTKISEKLFWEIVKVVFTPEMHAKVAWIVLHGTSRSPDKVIEHVLRGETAETPEGIHHILNEWIGSNHVIYKFYLQYPKRYWTLKP
jgi:hypothetical protein